TDVNNFGQIVGQFLKQETGSVHAFLHDSGRFTDLGSPLSPETNASAINDRAQIVGVQLVAYDRVCHDVGGDEVCVDLYKMHAFLHEMGVLTDLNSVIPSNSGWELSWAFDINNRGQIVGYGVIKDHFRAFLLTPAVSKKQCKHGGWKRFDFKNQGQCIQYLST